MLENAIYSVISPEGCATILWRDPTKTLEAAKAMKLSAKDLLKLEIIDEIIPEPLGGAHRDKDLILDNVRDAIDRNLSKFLTLNDEEILNQRKNKFLDIGRNKGFSTNSAYQDKLTIKHNLLYNLISNIKLNKKLFISTTSILLLLILLTMIF